jgi:hypothetical protein
MIWSLPQTVSKTSRCDEVSSCDGASNRAGHTSPGRAEAEGSAHQGSDAETAQALVSGEAVGSAVWVAEAVPDSLRCSTASGSAASNRYTT